MDKRIVKLVIITFVLYASLNFGHPVTPAFLKEMNISDRYFGVLFSTMAFALLLFSPFWGNKGDNYGRKIIIAIGIIGYGCGQLVFGLGGNLSIILVGRAIAGIFAAAIFSNHIAAFSEISNEDNRARNMALVVTIGGFGGTFGYFIGGMLGDFFQPSTALIIQGIFDIVLGLLILVFYPSTTIVAKTRKSFIQNIKHTKDIDRHIIYFLITVSFYIMAGNNIMKFMDVILNNNGFTTFQIGSFVMLVGIISGITNLVFVPKIAKKFDLLKTLITSLVLMIILIILTFSISNVYISLFVTYIAYFCIFSMYTSIDQTFISENTSSHFGSILGVRESFKAIGLVLGPVLITVLFKEVNEYVFYFNAFLYFLALISLLIFYKKRNLNKE